MNADPFANAAMIFAAAFTLLDLLLPPKNGDSGLLPFPIPVAVERREFGLETAVGVWRAEPRLGGESPSSCVMIRLGMRREVDAVEAEDGLATLEGARDETLVPAIEAEEAIGLLRELEVKL